MFENFISQWAHKPFSSGERIIVFYFLQIGFRGLTKRQKECIHMKYSDNKSQKEISEALGISRQAVRRHIINAEDELLKSINDAESLCNVILDATKKVNKYSK